MVLLDNDRWRGDFEVSEVGCYRFHFRNQRFRG